MIAKHRHSTASLSPCRARAVRHQMMSEVSMPVTQLGGPVHRSKLSQTLCSRLLRSTEASALKMNEPSLCLVSSWFELCQRPKRKASARFDPSTSPPFWGPRRRPGATEVRKARDRQASTQGRRPTRSESGAMTKHPTAFLAQATLCVQALSGTEQLNKTAARG